MVVFGLGDQKPTGSWTHKRLGELAPAIAGVGAVAAVAAEVKPQALRTGNEVGSVDVVM